MKALTVVLIVLACILLLYLLLSFIAAMVCYDMAFARELPSYADKLLGGKMSDNPDDPVAMKRASLFRETEEFVKNSDAESLFMTSFDGLKLHATLLRGDESKKRAFVLVHGFHGKSTGDFGGLVQFYHENGYTLLLPDDRGHHESEGKLLGFGWPDRRDVVMWTKKLVEIMGEDVEIILSGVSMGGATVMMASGEDDLPEQVKLIIEDCGFSSSMSQFGSCFPKQVIAFKWPILFFSNLISKVRNHYFLTEADALKQVAKCTRPMYFIHGDSDTFVPTKMIYDNYAACKTEKGMLLIKGAEHAQAFSKDSETYIANVTGFIRKTMKFF